MRIIRLLLLVQFIWVGSIGAFPVVPDSDMTPGALCSEKDRDYEKKRYSQKIAWCRRNVSTAVKTEIYRAYGINLKCRRNFTIDHFIPLSIGGNNADENLWPEHKAVKELRRDLEQEVFEAVREGELSQDEAVDIVIEEKMNPPVIFNLLTLGCRKTLP